MTDKAIKEKVLEENEKSHDFGAKYHTSAVAYQSRRITRNYMWKFIVKQFRENNIEAQNAKVLEVACGTGTFVKLFQKLKSKSYKGIDISGEMIKIAKENNQYPNVSFEKISLEDFAKNNSRKYDIIISSSFLHHLVELEEGLSQIKSMLNEGGIYIALHEIKANREFTKIEMFDNALFLLFRSDDHLHLKFHKRLCNFLKFMRYLIRSIITGRNYKLKTKLLNEGVDYVDYQLNFDFDLRTNEIVKKIGGKVIPYCYYQFVELRFLKKMLNFDCLVIIKKEKE